MIEDSEKKLYVFDALSVALLPKVGSETGQLSRVKSLSALILSIHLKPGFYWAPVFSVQCDLWNPLNSFCRLGPL